VSALQSVPIEVEVVPPPGVAVSTTLTAIVRHVSAGLIYEAPLVPHGGHLYAADEPLRLPLEPPPGAYRLIILVDSNVNVSGNRVVSFKPLPIPSHDLFPGGERGVHDGLHLIVPLEYRQTVGSGDPWAGVRSWRMERGTLSLAWAPGPTEDLLINNALVMLEATFPDGDPPQVVGVEQTEWKGQPAFLFHEHWSGPEAGPAETLVVQGPDFWLYALRIAATGGAAIPAVLYEVRDTFTAAP
jgi:hypothetical protein